MFGYHIFMISPFGWLLVLSLYKEDYWQLCVLLITRLLQLVEKGTRCDYTSWKAVVTPTDRP